MTKEQQSKIKEILRLAEKANKDLDMPNKAYAHEAFYTECAPITITDLLTLTLKQAEELEEAIKVIEFYSDKSKWSKLDSPDIERVVMWGDSTEQNDACHYAGKRAREFLTKYNGGKA